MNTKIAQQLVIFLIITVLSSGIALTQNIGKPVASKEIKEYFDNIYKTDPRLISGDFYQTPRMSKSFGHPYFINWDWKEGSVVLDGIQFDSLLLRYDISSNEIILNTRNFTSSYLQLILKRDHISTFKMGDHMFRPFPGKPLANGLFFCEVLAEGEIDFLLLRSKKMTVTVGGMEDQTYQTNQSEYVFINESLSKYHGRRTLFKLFPELKAEIRDFIKTNRLKYRRLKLDEHVKLINHCNSLLKEK